MCKTESNNSALNFLLTVVGLVQLFSNWAATLSRSQNHFVFSYRPWSPPSLLYNGYRVSFPGVKRPDHGVNHSPLYSAEVKERVELYLYSPYGPSWPVLGRTLPSFLPCLRHDNEAWTSECYWAYESVFRLFPFLTKGIRMPWLTNNIVDLLHKLLLMFRTLFWNNSVTRVTIYF
jgi:hypothetical protein